MKAKIMENVFVVEWDWKEHPCWVEVGDCIEEFSNQPCFMEVKTGSDSHAVIITPWKISKQLAQKHYDDYNT